MAGSLPAPKMISASSPTASWMMSLIWVVSPRVRSSPPMMLISTPVAPAMETLSSSGLEMACWAASSARLSPRPMPVPISAAPPFCITVRTSAKSTLMMPVLVIRLEMPWVACSSTSSAFLSASWNGMPLPTTASSRSLGTTIMVSTFFRSSAMPFLGLLHPPPALEEEGLGDDADGERAGLARHLGHDRRGAGAGTAAHAAGDEDHVGALDRLRPPRPGSPRSPAGRSRAGRRPRARG